MIYVAFDISWPWPKSWKEEQKDYVEIEKPLTKNKNFTLQISKSMNFHTIFGFHLDTSWRGQDHAGLRFGLTIGRYFLVTAIEDRRHWNWKTNAWYTDEEAIAEYEEWKKEIENEQ